MVDLTTELAGLELRNPLMSASGTFGHGLEMQHIVPPSSVGALVSKTVTLLPRGGNPMPRLCETEAGLLNSIGLENRGIDHYLEVTLREVAGADTMIVTNLGGFSPAEFAEIAARVEDRPEIDAVEINLSCPNVDGGKLPFSTVPELTRDLVAGVRKVLSKPLIAKLSPNVTDIASIARAAEEGGADAQTAVNTVLGMAVDWRARRPLLNTGAAGYSGPGIKPIALRCAWDCARAVSIPVIGCGGITTADDVLEFLVAGCAAVQVGTSSFSDPARLGGLVGELEAKLEEAGVGAVRELVGAIAAPGARPLVAPVRPEITTR